jgi:hypothetical protein
MERGLKPVVETKMFFIASLRKSFSLFRENWWRKYTKLTKKIAECYTFPFVYCQKGNIYQQHVKQRVA